MIKIVLSEKEINQLAQKQIDIFMSNNKSFTLLDVCLRVAKDFNHIEYNKICKMIRDYIESDTDLQIKIAMHNGMLDEN